MGFRVAFDNPSSTVRVKQFGDDCDVVDAMNTFEAMHADPAFRSIARLLIDLSECHAELKPLEVEAISEYLCAVFHGRFLVFVSSDELGPHLAYATEILRREGAIDARVFPTAPDAEAWLRTVN